MSMPPSYNMPMMVSFPALGGTNPIATIQPSAAGGQPAAASGEAGTGEGMPNAFAALLGAATPATAGQPTPQPIASQPIASQPIAGQLMPGPPLVDPLFAAAPQPPAEDNPTQPQPTGVQPANPPSPQATTGQTPPVAAPQQPPAAPPAEPVTPPVASELPKGPDAAAGTPTQAAGPAESPRPAKATGAAPATRPARAVSRSDAKAVVAAADLPSRALQPAEAAPMAIVPVQPQALPAAATADPEAPADQTPVAPPPAQPADTAGLAAIAVQARIGTPSASADPDAAPLDAETGKKPANPGSSDRAPRDSDLAVAPQPVASPALIETQPTAFADQPEFAAETSQAIAVALTPDPAPQPMVEQGQSPMPRSEPGVATQPSQLQAGPFDEAAPADMSPRQAAAADGPAPDADIAVSTRSLEGLSELDVRLNPSELGRVDVRLSIPEKGRMEAIVAAENPAALELLRREGAELARALSAAAPSSDGASLSFQSRTSDDQSNRRSPARQRTGTAAPIEETQAEWRPMATSGRIERIA